ncbi:hypothetical protein [Achromobacter aloeverae]
MEDLTSKRNGSTYKRFDKTVYEVAREHKIDALPLLDALEFSRSIASGVGSLLLILRAQDDEETDDSGANGRFDRAQIDDLLSLCITSLDLLNSKIEAVADLMTARYGLQ